MKSLAVLLILMQYSAIVLANEIQSELSCNEYNFCHGSAQCFITAQKYKCRCPIGLAGKHCEKTLDPCSLDPCKYGCTSLNAFQFKCEPSVLAINRELLRGVHPNLESLFKQPDEASNCDSFGLCQNGGRCYTGYRNTNTLAYKCFCPKEFTGLNCQTRNAYGYDAEQIFKHLKEDESDYAYPYAYTFMDGFSESFLLLNTEISSNLSVNRIEFHAARKGRFSISFVQVPDCDPEQEECARKLFERHEKIEQNLFASEEDKFKYSEQLEKMLNSTRPYVITGIEGFNTIDLQEPIPVVKGSILCITQLDGRLGGLLPRKEGVAGMPDLVIKEKKLSDLQFTVNVTKLLPRGSTESFFSVLVMDTSLVNETIFSNSDISYIYYDDASTDRCVNHLCVNGGLCIPTEFGEGGDPLYSCACQPDVVGKYCDTVIDRSTTVTRPTEQPAELTDDEYDSDYPRFYRG